MAEGSVKVMWGRTGNPSVSRSRSVFRNFINDCDREVLG